MTCLQDRDDVLSTMDNTVKVSRYIVLNDDGGLYEVLDDLIVSEQHRLLVRMASDYEVDEKFTRRADGTNMLLNSDGELIVRYPGTFQRTCHFVGRILISARYYISFNEIDTSKSDKMFEKLRKRFIINVTVKSIAVVIFHSATFLFLLRIYQFVLSSNINSSTTRHANWSIVK